MSTSTSHLRSRSAIRIVATREVRERLRAPSFRIATGILVVVIIGIGVVNRLVGSDDGPAELKVALVQGATPGVDEALTAASETLGRSIEVEWFDDASAARAAVEDDTVDLALLTDRGELVFDDAVDEQALAIAQQAWARSQITASLEEQGLTPDVIAAALTPEPLQVTLLDDDGNETMALLVGTVAAVLLFIAVQTFGGYVLTGVVEEKSTAVVEVLLVRVRANQLLAGKVIGIGVAAMAQMALATLAAIASLTISGVDVSSQVWSAVPMVLVWFIGGYALYSTLFAVAGALVSRQEDAQAAAAPIMSVLIAAYAMVFLFGYAPESTASRVMSVLPPTAPFLMPVRMASGAASVVEVVVALVLLGASVLAAWNVTGRIYEQVVLHRGTRISWRAALGLLSAPRTSGSSRSG